MADSSAARGAYIGGVGLVGLSALSFSVLYIADHGYAPYAMGAFDLGILTCVLAVVRGGGHLMRFLLALVLVGAALQGMSLAGMPYSGKLFFSGLAMALAAGAYVTVLDAIRSRVIEGWVLTLLYALLAGVNLRGEGMGRINVVIGVLITLSCVMYVKRMLTSTGKPPAPAHPHEAGEGPHE